MYNKKMISFSYSSLLYIIAEISDKLILPKLSESTIIWQPVDRFRAAGADAPAGAELFQAEEEGRSKAQDDARQHPCRDIGPRHVP
jgi:hypothetical protein